MGLSLKHSDRTAGKRKPDIFGALPSSAKTSAAKPATAICVDTIYRKEARAIRLFVKRMVRNSCDAEDILQETFLRSWRTLADGGVACPRAFLFRTARNLALNHIRNARVRNSDAAQAASDEAFYLPVPSAEELIIASEEAAACRRLLEGLPNRCREAFMLRVVDDYSYKQMSESMRLAVSTVEKHIGKGKQICRSKLTNPALADPALEVLLSRVPVTRQALGRKAQRALAIAAE